MPKQKLLEWINKRMPPDFIISNFATDWNDGRAIATLVDSFTSSKICSKNPFIKLVDKN